MWDLILNIKAFYRLDIFFINMYRIKLKNRIFENSIISSKRLKQFLK